MSLRHADLALFLNGEDREYAVHRLGVHADRASIVDNGLPQAFLGLPEPQPEEITRIAVIGSFLERKGTGYLVPALTRLLGGHARLHVGLFGVGVPQRAVLDRFPESLRSRIVVVERYSNSALPTLLRGYSIQLLPSLSEGFGLAGLEGMACGLALITTTRSGIAERLADGEDALLVAPGNVAAIADAVERLLADGALLTKIRRAGWVAAQRFSWARIAKDTLALYQGVIERRRRARLL